MPTPYPKAGDAWEVRIPGRPLKTKIVGHVGYFGALGCQYVSWRRRNKGRYTGITVKALRKWGRRVSTEKERDQHFLDQCNQRRAELGKVPLSPTSGANP